MPVFTLFTTAVQYVFRHTEQAAYTHGVEARDRLAQTQKGFVASRAP